MENISKKYYGSEILVVNAINVETVKYIHKLNKKGFAFSSTIACFAILIGINIIYIVKSILPLV